MMNYPAAIDLLVPTCPSTNGMLILSFESTKSDVDFLFMYVND